MPDDRPLVLSSRTREPFLLLSDGRNPFPLLPLDKVWVARSDRPVLLLRPTAASFSDALRDKLGWSGGPPTRPNAAAGVS